MMTGHSFGEQPGKGIVGWNYFGQELGSRFARPADSVNWTRAYRSATISKAEYEAEPDMFIDWQGHPPIEKQIADGAKEIYCLAWAPRPFFLSLDSATNAFVYGIVDWRLKALQGSDNPEHKALASRVEAGDVDAYIEMVEMKDPHLKMRPYNGLPEYPGILKPHLQRAIADDKLSD